MWLLYTDHVSDTSIALNKWIAILYGYRSYWVCVHLKHQIRHGINWTGTQTTQPRSRIVLLCRSTIAMCVWHSFSPKIVSLFSFSDQIVCNVQYACRWCVCVYTVDWHWLAMGGFLLLCTNVLRNLFSRYIVLLFLAIKFFWVRTGCHWLRAMTTKTSIMSVPNGCRGTCVKLGVEKWCI